MTKNVCISLMKHVPATAFLIATLITGGGESAVFAQSANVVFVIDASGSMDSRINSGNQPKIEMVREALSETVGYMQSDRRVGVVAFGHRNKGDCEDVEELVPMVPLIGNRELIISNIAEITPVGMTPLGLAIGQAAEMLKTRNETGCIVLIVDGQDSCLGEPCEVTRRLKGANSKLIVHVIGLDASKGSENGLSCIAESGGGEFFQIRTPHELKSALQKAIKITDKGDVTDAGEETRGETKDTHVAEINPQEDIIGNFLEDGKPPEAAPPEEVSKKTAGSLVTRADVGRIHESPSLESPTRFRVMKGDIVSALEQKGEWFLVGSEGKTGWGHKSLFIELSVKNIVTIEKISVDVGQEEEKVVFEMNRACLPTVSFLEKDMPKVACDFADTVPAKEIGSNIKVNGKLIRGITAGVRGENGFRVVLDLVPGGEYELAHIFTKTETRYMLIVKNRAQNNGADG